jgi:hypothetical protein
VGSLAAAPAPLVCCLTAASCPTLLTACWSSTGGCAAWRCTWLCRAVRGDLLKIAACRCLWLSPRIRSALQAVHSTAALPPCHTGAGGRSFICTAQCASTQACTLHATCSWLHPTVCPSQLCLAAAPPAAALQGCWCGHC